MKGATEKNDVFNVTYEQGLTSNTTQLLLISLSGPLSLSVYKPSSLREFRKLFLCKRRVLKIVAVLFPRCFIKTITTRSLDTGVNLIARPGSRWLLPPPPPAPVVLSHGVTGCLHLFPFHYFNCPRFVPPHQNNRSWDPSSLTTVAMTKKGVGVSVSSALKPNLSPKRTPHKLFWPCSFSDEMETFLSIWKVKLYCKVPLQIM